MKSETKATILEALRRERYIASNVDDTYSPTLARIDAAIAELEAEAGAGWEPLADGSYHTNGPEMIRVNGARLEILRSDWCDLQQGYALCRRTTTAQQQPASTTGRLVELAGTPVPVEVYRLNGQEVVVLSDVEDALAKAQQPAPIIPHDVLSAIGDVWGFAYASASIEELEQAASRLLDWLHELKQQPAPYRDQAPRLVTQPVPSVPDAVREAWDAIQEALNSATRDDYADALDVMDRWVYEQ